MTNLSPTRGRPFWSSTKFILGGEGRDRDAYYEENGPPQPLETLFSPSEFLLFKIVSHCYHQFVHCIEEACRSYHLLPFVNAFTNCSLVLYNVSCKCGWKLDDYRALLWNEKDYFWTLCCKTSLEKTIGNVITFLLE